jgi:hypothetical protein
MLAFDNYLVFYFLKFAIELESFFRIYSAKPLDGEIPSIEQKCNKK